MASLYNKTKTYLRNLKNCRLGEFNFRGIKKNAKTTTDYILAFQGWSRPNCQAFKNTSAEGEELLSTNGGRGGWKVGFKGLFVSVRFNKER